MIRFNISDIDPDYNWDHTSSYTLTMMVGDRSWSDLFAFQIATEIKLVQTITLGDWRRSCFLSNTDCNWDQTSSIWSPYLKVWYSQYIPKRGGENTPKVHVFTYIGEQPLATVGVRGNSPGGIGFLWKLIPGIGLQPIQKSGLDQPTQRTDNSDVLRYIKVDQNSIGQDQISDWVHLLYTIYRWTTL